MKIETLIESTVFTLGFLLILVVIAFLIGENDDLIVFLPTLVCSLLIYTVGYYNLKRN